MRIWALALGPLVIWAVHFLGLYLIASLGTRHSDLSLTRWAAILFSAACLAAIFAASLAAAFSPRGGAWRMLARLGVVSGGLAAIAVSWQALAMLL